MTPGQGTSNEPVWNDRPWQALPPLEGDATADLCVVGLGGSGLAAVDEALAVGATVVGIDAGSVAGGAAGRNGGFLLAGMARFHHEMVEQVGRARAVALYRLTVDELDRMAAHTPDVVRRAGSIRIALDAAELEDCERHLASLQADGFPARWYFGPEGEGVLVEGDGVFQPLARVRRLARAAADAGARLFERTPAVDIGAGVVATPAGRVRCRATVVAVDGSLERVLPELEGRVRTARLQMLATAPDTGVAFARPLYLRWGYDYLQQLPDGRIALGGARDRCAEREWCHDAEPTEEVQRHLDTLLREMRVTARVTHRWAGCVGFTDDGLPVLEEVRRGVFACGGYSGTGNVVGAVCGRTSARLALGLDAPAAAVLV